MFNTQVTEKTINEQALSLTSDIEGMPIQVLYLRDTLKDSRHYACAKIVDLQDTFASLLMRWSKRFYRPTKLHTLYSVSLMKRKPYCKKQASA